jgi:hypothetical protein
MAARRRPVLGFMIVAAGALAFAGPALAASPQKIYKDLADNGKLDQRYSQADIARAFNLKRVMGTDPRRSPMRHPAAVTSGPTPAERSRRTIPFTGLDLALLTLGGGPLLLIGMGLRRRLAPAAAQPRVVGN